MDPLAHVFLPLSAAIAIDEGFSHPRYRLTIAGFGLLPDFDKFVGQPGLLHSLVLLVPLGATLVGIELAWRKSTELSRYASAFLGSHLVLDFVDGGPVPLLYPFVERGFGLEYHARTVFGGGPIGVDVSGIPITLVTESPQRGFRDYVFVNECGVASVLLFGVIYWGIQNRVSEP